MACCAFAAILVFNLLIPLGLRRMNASVAGNPAVAWRLGQAVEIPVAQSSRANRIRLLLGVVLAQLLVVSGVVAWSWSEPVTDGPMSETEWQALVEENTVWCIADTTERLLLSSFEGTQ